MKKIISIFLLTVIFSTVYAQNKVGGNVNSKEPIAYADKDFLVGILDYYTLKSIPAPQNWPKLLDNTFKFTYVAGECRMVPSEFLFDAAKKLNIQKEFTYDCEFHDGVKPQAKIAAIFIQKVQNEVYYRAFYKAEDIIPDEVKNGNLPSWIYNTDPVSIFQKIYFKDGTSVTVYHSTYSMQEGGGGSKPSCFTFKIFGNFDIFDSNHFAFTNFVFRDLDIKVYNSTTAFYNKPNKHFNLIAEFDFGNYHSLYLDGNSVYDYYFRCTGDPLIEKDYSRYSLINMFDNNPETSFVEDLVDDNINLKFGLHLSDTNINKVKIINGYAQTENLYFKNNRIKTLSIKNGNNAISVELKETLQPQVFDVDFFSRGFSVKTTELYKGTKYNDTCIAEFDILTDEGWLIGD
ncbi:MAG: hypothetical protein K6E51_04300 [Treponema sp.]|nr:hypothetical protein [Treponema sp.]